MTQAVQTNTSGDEDTPGKHLSECLTRSAKDTLSSALGGLCTIQSEMSLPADTYCITTAGPRGGSATALGAAEHDANAVLWSAAQVRSHTASQQTEVAYRVSLIM